MSGLGRSCLSNFGRLGLVLAGLAVVAAASGAAAEPAQPPPDVAALHARSATLTPAQQAQARTLFSSAFKLWQAGDFQSAELGFAQGLQLDPANGAANYYYGDTLQRRGDPRARTYMANAAALTPATPEGLKAQVFLQQQASSEQAKADADKQANDVVARWATALPGKWTVKRDGWPLATTITFSMGPDGKPRSSNLAYFKFQSSEFQGDEVVLHYHGCMVLNGCGDGEYRWRLVSPTHLEGSTVWTGSIPARNLVHAEKQQ